MRLGIDASNIRAGGGITHLMELLRAAKPWEYGMNHVVVWGGQRTLERLPAQPWLTLAHQPQLDGALPRRAMWQQVRLPRLANNLCELLFVPGGTYLGWFKPFVAMSRNLLPFEPTERQRFGLSWNRLRLTLLEKTQATTFRRADGMIFLTKTARQTVEQQTGALSCQVTVVPHGVADSLRLEPRPQKPISEYTMDHPFRLLYVSDVAPYKHQWHVAEAVARLRQEGLAVELDLVGTAYSPALRRLREAMARFDEEGKFLHYRGPVAYSQLTSYYHQADGFVFASSCENMPNILLEAMASGLPVACSQRGPMPEILADAGIYFDPEQPREIVAALRTLMGNPALREQFAWSAYNRAQHYSWNRCAGETFQFLADVARKSGLG